MHRIQADTKKRRNSLTCPSRRHSQVPLVMILDSISSHGSVTPDSNTSRGPLAPAPGNRWQQQEHGPGAISCSKQDKNHATDYTKARKNSLTCPSRRHSQIALVMILGTNCSHGSVTPDSNPSCGTLPPLDGAPGNRWQSAVPQQEQDTGVVSCSEQDMNHATDRG